jgi:hypothetical protein
MQARTTWSTVKGDADEQRNHAFTDRAKIVLFRGVESDYAERGVPSRIFSSEIVLVDQHSVASNNHCMGVGLCPAFETRADAADQRQVETLLFGRGDSPTVTQIGRSTAARRRLGYGRG